MPPVWLTALAWFSLGLAFLTAGLIVHDIHVRRFRQRMWIMEIVWPVTALYFGPFALWAYRRWGRPRTEKWQAAHGEAPGKPFWAVVSVGVSHCGAGCTLGDIVGGWLILAGGFEIAGLALWPEYIVDYVLAFTLGIIFQYFSIAPMRGLGFRDGIVAALKADTLSLTAFEIGLFGWMALIQFVFFPVGHLHPDHAAYWFLMQIGMILVVRQVYFDGFRTPVRFKHKARDRVIAVALARERNAVIGAHRRSRYIDHGLVGRGCPRPWTALRRLTRAMAIACAARLATNAGSLAEPIKIDLSDHQALPPPGR